ncbi:serine/threonine protein phosphatase [Cylindrospermum stagnale PCC 7417]|uniref:Serine/threonine protein phosphatase n=1 Tax=Cylindrospermum stagnale PCC 7417 TaxID=56107 RepID=K9X127_9NOST|nr:protein phosphatase 2C domain-containing protein [Cylindrospermum stagnale]AFZ25746.1 serine/threonine protein phosphatase [Cylindrospermum stagnale PCC 7417]
MSEDVPTLYCPNEYCQAANPLNHKFCQQCRTPIPKRYLWAVGDGLSLSSPGEILADRYLVISTSIVLDTRPSLSPLTPELDDLQAISAYLRLIPYRLHIPQVYGVLLLAQGQSRKEILLLEKPPLDTDGEPTQVNLCSEFTTAWRDASSLRQINYLWQIAHLWQPLLSEGAASSLIDPYLLRVEGSLVRLLELRVDSITAPTLSQLGEFWLPLASEAQPAIAEFVQQISHALIQGEINSSEQLITVLDRGLAELGRASSGGTTLTQTSSLKIFTKTDTGPSRQRNEDACYPPAGNLVSKPPQQIALAIVCDGIGGHEGGNVASALAIETLQQQVKQLTSVPYDHIDPSLLLSDLELAVASVNDKISQRNDNEKRQGRQRMGTTLVMALPIAHSMYITHVGDSRAYWITRHGCYQVTLDDDVASREVRLGYAIYRDAVQQGGAGSLVQALGMSKSTSLHPTSQRFILDEDAVFLLASDGLTDFDRVEDYWETEILPILTGKTNVENVAEKLVEIANTKNGHDNVTIALVHYQAKYSEPESSITADLANSVSVTTADLAPRTTDGTDSDHTSQKTKVIPDSKPNTISQLPLHWIVPLLLAVAAGLAGFWVMQLRSPSFTISTPVNPETTPNPTTEATPTPRNLANLAIGWVIQTNTQISLNNQESFPTGSFLQVIGTNPKPKAAGDLAVNLRVCSTSSPSTTGPAKSKSVTKPEKTVLFDLSQLQRFGVSVLQSDEPSPCDQPSVSQPQELDGQIDSNPTEPKTR